MILEQHYLACLSHASYLIGDASTGRAAVVDPQRDVERYLESAQRHGLQIESVFLTHLHADFVSGHLELAQRTGAKIHIGHRARTEFAVQGVREGDRFDLGGVRLEVLETPGHTPESISLLVYPSPQADLPHAVLTGDALFLGDVGRPDLMVGAGVAPGDLAASLYDTLHSKFARLPDGVLVYPAHGAGSACGKNISKDLVGTLGQQRALNWALQPMPKADFVQHLTSDLAAPPAYFAHDAVLNQKQRACLDAMLESALRPLSFERAAELHAKGALLLDVREADDYARAHLHGSVNVGLSGRFAAWVGTVIAPDTPLVLLADAGREREAALRLGRIGYDRIEGFWTPDPKALADAQRSWRVVAHPRASVPEFQRLLQTQPHALLLDVRTSTEYAQGHLAGSWNVPLETLLSALSQAAQRNGTDAPALRQSKLLAIHCQGGYRSSIAASLLEREGYEVGADLVGGFAAWKNAGLPVERA